MNRSILFLSAVILITGISSAELPELIPREVLFGNPERIQPQLSPCGEYIAYVAPVDDVMNVWVMNIDGSEPRQITFDTNRGVRMYFWAENGKHILYMQDEAGEENFHVYMLDAISGELTDITPFEGVRAFVSTTDDDFPNMVHINMNQNNPMYFDVYEADLETGELTMIEENPGNVLGYMSDEDMVIKLAYTMNPMNGDIGILIRDTPEDEWREFMSFPSTESVEPLSFSKDGSGIYIRSNLSSNTTQLLYHDFASGEETLIIQDDLADVGGVSFDPFRIVPRSVSFNYLRRRVEILDASIQADYDYLETVSEGDFFVASRDNADSTWIVGYYTVFNPVSYFVYDRTVKNAEYLFSAIPELENYELSDMEPVLIEARDGLLLPSYLTLPSGLEHRNLPMVLYVHGGPWYRDFYGYEPFVQLMANRGFAVLRVNFRASTGFGKEFMNAGNQGMGRGDAG